jgi:hypothetical protein
MTKSSFYYEDGLDNVFNENGEKVIDSMEGVLTDITDPNIHYGAKNACRRIRILLQAFFYSASGVFLSLFFGRSPHFFLKRSIHFYCSTFFFFCR